MKKPLIRLFLTILIIDSANGGEGKGQKLADKMIPKKEFDAFEGTRDGNPDNFWNNRNGDVLKQDLERLFFAQETGLPDERIKAAIAEITGKKAGSAERGDLYVRFIKEAFGHKFGKSEDEMKMFMEKLRLDNRDAIVEAEELIAEAEKNARAFKEIGEMLTKLYNEELKRMKEAKFFTKFDFVKKSLAKKCKKTEEQLEALKCKMQSRVCAERAKGYEEFKTMIENAQRHESKPAEERLTSSGFRAVPWMAMIVVILYFVQ